jgi:hypothetical protein
VSRSILKVVATVAFLALVAFAFLVWLSYIGSH